MSLLSRGIERRLRRAGHLLPGDRLREVILGEIVSLAVDGELIKIGTVASWGGGRLPARRRPAALGYSESCLVLTTGGWQIFYRLVELKAVRAESATTVVFEVSAPAVLRVSWKMRAPVAQDFVARLRRQRQSAIERLNPTERIAAALAMGNFAYAEGDEAATRRAWLSALDSTRPEAVAGAAFNLGLQAAGQGTEDEALAFYTRAIESGVPDIVPMAELNRAVILSHRGDPEPLIGTFRRLRMATDPVVAAKANMVLARILNDRGDVEDAVDAYRAAAESGQRELVPRANLLLGCALVTLDDIAAARSAFQLATTSGDDEIRAAAQECLAALYKLDAQDRK